jgi:ribonuclease P protein component
VTSAAARLPRTARLNAAAQFVGHFPQRFHGNWYQILARPTEGAAGARLGLIVGRKAAPRAVDRAFARRLARESFRIRRSALPAVDVVIRLRAQVSRRDRAAAGAELRALLDRLK